MDIRDDTMTDDSREKDILEAMVAGDKEVFMKLLIELKNEDKVDTIYDILTKYWNRKQEQELNV